MPFSHPTYGGVAIWLHSLIIRAKRAKTAIDGLYFIKDHPMKAEAETRFERLEKSLDDIIVNRKYQEWQQKMANASTSERIDQACKNHLLVRSEHRQQNRNIDLKDERTQAILKKAARPDLLESNFDTDLLKLLYEVQAWNKMHGMITFPLPITRLLAKREQLRILRENVMLIVRDYNSIMLLLNNREKALFNEQITYLDKFIQPGVDRWEWLQCSDGYVPQCRTQALDTYKKINDF